jgi:uncharacterized small protein (DUF1192 family)
MLRKNQDGEIEEVKEVVEVINTDNLEARIQLLNQRINELQAQKAELKAYKDLVVAEKLK